jgi:hypothetical protein
MNRLLLVLLLALPACTAECSCSSSTVTDAGPDVTIPDVAPPSPSGPTTQAVLSNLTDAGASVNVSFGSDSVIGPSSWASFCTATPSGCTLSLPAGATQPLPMGGQYTNATFAFNGPVGCGSSLGEFTANNPNGYGTADISLVNGANAKIAIYVNGQTLGPAIPGGDNSKVSGVFPVACDLCVARGQPPCGFDAGGCTTSGSCGCKSGSQYNPSVPCQITYQRGGAGSLLNITLLP